MEKVISLLKENQTLTIATSANDKPRASILEYYISKNGSILVATSPDSIKAYNIKLNKQVSISICAMPKFVTIDGTIAEPNQDELEEFKKVIFERHPEFTDFVANGIMKFSYHQIVPQTAYYNDYSAGMAPTEVIPMK